MPYQFPHVEEKVTCQCGERYCVICMKKCPACRGVHLQPTDPWGYPKGKPRFKCGKKGLEEVWPEANVIDADARRLPQPMVTTPFFQVDLPVKEEERGTFTWVQR